MPDNPYTLMRPTSLSGGLRKAQMKAIRERQLNWARRHGIQHYALTTTPLPEGLGWYCICGHVTYAAGDPEELMKIDYICPKCGRKFG